MKERFFSIIMVFSFLIGLGSCGDETDLFPQGDQYLIESVSISDGEILSRPAADQSGPYIFFRVSGNETKASNLTLVTELYNVSGNLVARHEKATPAINADIPIELSSQLSPGFYDVELTLVRDDTFLAKQKRSFFLVQSPPVIQGILSYPLMIVPSSPVLLMVDTVNIADLNPYLRWTQGNEVLAKGLLSEGYDQILWEAPNDDGVFSVTVEIFPFPPAEGSEFLFAAPSAAQAELFITRREPEKAVETKAALPHYSLFDIYISALREREKSDAVVLKQPRPVIIGEAIGMKFDGSTGFICPESIVPLNTRSLQPWTLSLGVSFAGDNSGRTLFRLVGNDKSYTLECVMGQENEPLLKLTTDDDVYVFPSGITKMPPGMRTLLTISVTPTSNRWRVIWKLDGTVTSDTEKAVSMKSDIDDIRTIIGGEKSVRCVIDTFDIHLQ